MSSSAQPLKVPTTPRTDEKTPKPPFKQIGGNKNLGSPSDISSPHELTAFVETLLEQLDSKFDEMSSQILERMNQMSTRVDALEASIQDIINGDVSVPQSPSPTDSSGVAPGSASSYRKSLSKTREPSRKGVEHYESLTDLLRALRIAFNESVDVDFAGRYFVNETGITHQNRVKAVAHEIWKATGYRFTIKDHPRTSNGHKIRLWCSQDEAHKSKHSRARLKPRTTAEGVVLAKSRYPCRSGLLISSRETEEEDTSQVIIRMHHHNSHEPYYDNTVPPDMKESIWSSMGWGRNKRRKGMPPPEEVVEEENENENENDTTSGSRSRNEEDEEEEDEIQEENEIESEDEPSVDDASDKPSSEDNDASTSKAAMQARMARTRDPPRRLSPRLPSMEMDPPSNPPSPTPGEARKRLREHIGLIRAFCDGLEYQMRLNDPTCTSGLLKELETHGSQFLGFVHNTLEKEHRANMSSSRSMDLD